MQIIIKKIIACLSFAMLISCSSSSNEKKIGVIMPLENKALDEIIVGFKENIQANSIVPIKFKVANAQGDLNIQHAIINQMKTEHYDIIAPIGTAATQMTLSMVKQPIVSLAANYTAKERSALAKCNLALVHDEIAPQKIIEFIHTVYPNMRYLTLVHSGTDKIYADVTTAIINGKKLGITITPMMTPTLNDLYSAANSLPTNTQGILILKDILVASGISILAHAAQKYHLPLIAADQGSVQDGAAFALGVYEKDIGAEGGILATAILQGKEACKLPIIEMKKLIIFVNKNNLAKANLSLVPIQKAAMKNNYRLVFTNAGGE